MIVSCSKDERNCSTCHIVVHQLNYPYYLTELEEFCDEELTINQNNGFYISDTIFNDYNNNPLPSQISPGDTIIIVETVIHINLQYNEQDIYILFLSFLHKIYFHRLMQLKN